MGIIWESMRSFLTLGLDKTNPRWYTETGRKNKGVRTMTVKQIIAILFLVSALVWQLVYKHRHKF